MKFFIDTANIQEIRDAAALGIVDGVTTNPSLVAKEGRDFQQVLREIVSIVNGPISAEVTALDKDGMLKQGRELAKIHPNITIKVPLTKEGLQACKVLRGEGTAGKGLAQRLGRCSRSLRSSFGPCNWSQPRRQICCETQ